MMEMELADIARTPIFVKAGAVFPGEDPQDTDRSEDQRLGFLDVLTADEATVDALMVDDADDDLADAPVGPLASLHTGTSLEEAPEIGFDSLPAEVSVTAIQESVEINDGVVNVTESISKMEVVSVVPSQADVATEGPSSESDVEDPTQSLFYVDTIPADTTVEGMAFTEVPMFDRAAGILGQDHADSRSEGDDDEEEILFVPRKFPQPQPIHLLLEQVAVREKRRPVKKGGSLAAHQAQREAFIEMSSRAANKASKKNKGHGTTKKQEKKAKRRERRRQETELSAPRLGDSDLDWGSENDSDLQDNPVIDEALADYVQNLSTRLPGHKDVAVQMARGSDEDSEAVNEDVDMDALRHFAMGMGAGQVSINDIDDARKQREEDEADGWVDSSGSDGSGVDGEETVPVTGPDGLEEAGQAIIDGSSSDDGLNPEDFDDNDSEDEDDDDYDDDDYRFFKGKSTWANDSEGFIQNIERVLDENAFMLAGSGKRKNRNKLFKAIEKGDFGDDWAMRPSPKGNKQKAAHVPVHLQKTWEKDRQKKAEYKRNRAAERLEAELSLYPASKKGKGKGKGKGLKYEDLSSQPRSAREMSALFDLDADDDDTDFVRKRKFQPVTDLASLNEEIKVFLTDAGKTTMTLPPMEKFSRKRVHELATCYQLKSQSKGKGRGRFPILIKTSYSSVEVTDPRKVGRIIGASTNGEFYKAKYAKGPKLRMPGSAGRSGGVGLRHMDGDTVGGEASAIGQDNIGHRLLSKMGWSEGDRIGMSGGLDAPIVAIIKNSKTGLGA